MAGDLIEGMAAAMWLTEEWFDGSGPGASRWTWERLDTTTQTYWLAKARAAWAYALAALREPRANTSPSS
jgi:hypothetical protein